MTGIPLHLTPHVLSTTHVYYYTNIFMYLFSLDALMNVISKLDLSLQIILTHCNTWEQSRHCSVYVHSTLFLPFIYHNYQPFVCTFRKRMARTRTWVASWCRTMCEVCREVTPARSGRTPGVNILTCTAVRRTSPTADSPSTRRS